MSGARGSKGCDLAYDYSLKCVVLGDSGVGKTSLLQRMNNNKHATKTTPTVEGIYHSKSLTVNQRKIQISIWDTAGQETFRSVTRIYYRGASCAILVYDITRRSTFEDINVWLEDLKNNCNNDKTITVLVANKCDLIDERAVSQEEGESFAKQHHMSYLETSAHRCSKVDEILHRVSQDVYNSIKVGSIVPNSESNGIRVGHTPSIYDTLKPAEKKKQGCGC